MNNEAMMGVCLVGGAAGIALMYARDVAVCVAGAILCSGLVLLTFGILWLLNAWLIGLFAWAVLPRPYRPLFRRPLFRPTAGV